MQLYNVLVESQIRLGTGSINVVVVAFKNISDIQGFKDAITKAIKLYNSYDEADEKELDDSYYSDKDSTFSCHYNELLEHRYSFEEGLMMFALC